MAAVLTEPGTAKAATLTPGGEMAFFSFPIEKVEDGGDGDVIVWGKATDGTLDSDLQIVDPDWSLKALQDWYETGGNVRVQHQAQRDPAGRGIEVAGHHVKVRVVEPVAVKLVKAGVLQDFSIGIMNPDLRVRDPRFAHLDPQGKAVNGILTGRDDGMSKIGEVSLVDRGSNFGTKFAVVKAAADGSPQWVGELTAPADVVAKVTGPRVHKTVSVDLPASMRIKVSPADLAKMNTMAQRVAARQAVTKVAEPAGQDAAAVPRDAVKALIAAESAVYKRDIDTATRERLAKQGRALADGSYPIETHEDAGNAVTLALSGHGDVAGAKALIRRVAREEGWTDILDRLKGKKKDAAKAAAVKCVKCDDTGTVGRDDQQPCPDCKKGRKAAKAAAALDAAVTTDVTVVKKKTKVMCGSCGAKQNIKHVHCPECGQPLHPGAIPVMHPIQKNHDFACLHCGTDLDKGEKFCPQCGKENPGYLEAADRKLPMNADKAAKERVSTVTKKAKGKGKKKGKAEPFGGSQAKPFGAKDDDGDGDTAKTAVTKGKKKGKGRSPAAGVKGHETAGLPPHREPDGPAVEAFESDLGASDGDCEMKAAMRLKALGIDAATGHLHDLTCPAFAAADVAKCFPGVTFAGIDTEVWQRKALDAAAGPDVVTAMARYNEMAALSQAAVLLKTVDPLILDDLRAERHAAFREANKTFTDATPGPGAFPTPSHPMPGQFRRPYIAAGHGAPSPGHDAPRSFASPEGQIAASDYHRGYLAEGRASDAPANDGTRHEPQPQPMTGGKPESVRYEGTMRANAESAISAMHDHISRIFPGVCPMSPAPGEGQKPAPGVPDAVGGPVPHNAKTGKPKASKAERKARAAQKAAKAAKAKAAKARKAARAEIRKARSTAAVPDAVPAAVTPAPLDADAITKAVAAATRPLVRQLSRQDRKIRKLRVTADAIAGERDTTGAPFRGAGVAKMTSPALAGPVTAAQSAELAQTAHLQRLHHEWRTSPNPEMREAAYREMTAQLGINPMTGSTSLQTPLT